MQVTNIHEAKTHLSKLLERVAAGEEIVIGKAGKPVARLFDRMLIAQAAVESLTLLTADRQQAVYDVPVILA